MPHITYQPINHNNEHRILVLFEHNTSLNEKMRAVPGAKWSRTYRGWTIPDTVANRTACKLPTQNTGQAEPATKQLIAAPELSQISHNNMQELNKYYNNCN